jgi:hypothetical protein
MTRDLPEAKVNKRSNPNNNLQKCRCLRLGKLDLVMVKNETKSMQEEMGSKENPGVWAELGPQGKDKITVE